jgi:hypothetical protein
MAQEYLVNGERSTQMIIMNQDLEDGIVPQFLMCSVRTIVKFRKIVQNSIERAKTVENWPPGSQRDIMAHNLAPR